MYILVCGGREYKNKEKVFDILGTIVPAMDTDEWVEPKQNIHIVEGGATGVDQFAGEWAKANKYLLHEVPADWAQYGKAAGPIRNNLMLKVYPIDLVIAFKGGSGTKDMVAKALKKGIIVLKVAE